MAESEVKRGKNGRRTQAERTALSDQRMFDAAIRLIMDRGTQKTTLKDIGEMAGYSRGLANYRFGSKDGLMLELFARFDERSTAEERALFPRILDSVQIGEETDGGSLQARLMR